MSTLDDLRNDIDRIDEVLVRLLNERARVACEIGRMKKELGIEIYQPEREKQVLLHVRSVAAEGPLGPDAIARLFERVIDEARGLERRLMQEEEDRAGGSHAAASWGNAERRVLGVKSALGAWRLRCRVLAVKGTAWCSR